MNMFFSVYSLNHILECVIIIIRDISDVDESSVIFQCYSLLFCMQGDDVFIITLGAKLLLNIGSLYRYITTYFLTDNIDLNTSYSL